MTIFTVNAGEDVEDLIEEGYTCSLATLNDEISLENSQELELCVTIDHVLSVSKLLKGSGSFIREAILS